MVLKCGSCGVGLLGQEEFVKFPCPACGQETIIRDRQCKLQSVPYVCSKCNFEGP